jgi:hypothetical protein
MNENKLFNAIVSGKEFQFGVAFVIAFSFGVGNYAPRTHVLCS